MLENKKQRCIKHPVFFFFWSGSTDINVVSKFLNAHSQLLYFIVHRGPAPVHKTTLSSLAVGDGKLIRQECNKTLY